MMHHYRIWENDSITEKTNHIPVRRPISLWTGLHADAITTTTGCVIAVLLQALVVKLCLLLLWACSHHLPYFWIASLLMSGYDYLSLTISIVVFGQLRFLLANSRLLTTCNSSYANAGLLYV